MITGKQVAIWQAAFDSDPKYRLACNAVCRNEVLDVLVSREHEIQATVNEFSTRMKFPEAKVTNQKSTGRCGLFAATNVIRLHLIQKYKLPDTFELSQPFLFFWDKFERANFFLESMIQTASDPVDSRLVAHLLQKPVEDGGQYDMFVKIVQKHGLVPKSAMPETKHSCSSARVNWLVNTKLREFGRRVRERTIDQSIEQARVLKDQQLQEIYRILCIFFGPPPTRFDWQFRDKDQNFQNFLDLTPLTFVQHHVPFDVTNMVSLIHDPRNEYHRLYTVDFLGNVVEAGGVRYINVPIDELKKYAALTIQQGNPVWFGCDVGKWFHRSLHVMDTQLLDYKLVFDVDFEMSKKERLLYGQSLMTHAMVFNAFDGDLETSGGIRRWRVENSWGDTNNKGFATMSDAWFDQFMYQIVVDKTILPPELQAVLEQTPHVLPAWDPMGALAQ
jgi:bleomycin hydrolase